VKEGIIETPLLDAVITPPNFPVGVVGAVSCAFNVGVPRKPAKININIPQRDF
jgi:hypothetical protein